MSEVELSQLEATLVMRVSAAGAVAARGSMPIAAYTSVLEVVEDLRENQVTSSLPLASAARTAGMKFRAPATGLSASTGGDWPGASLPRLKLCSRTSPSGW